MNIRHLNLFVFDLILMSDTVCVYVLDVFFNSDPLLITFVALVITFNEEVDEVDQTTESHET